MKNKHFYEQKNNAMRKILLLVILVTSVVIQSYSQISVDSIKINSESADSLEIMAYTTMETCHFIDSIKYVNLHDSLIVSFYCSEEFPHCDCFGCQRQDLFKIKKNSYNKVIFNLNIRNFANDACTTYSNYFLYAKGVLSLTSIDIIEIDKNEVIIYPNPVKDELFFKRDIERDYDVRISDMNGITLVEKKLSNSESINISSLPAGLYFLSIDNKTIYKLTKY